MPISPNGMRTGRLSNEEKLYIEENAAKLTASQMAKKLTREIETISKYLVKIGKSADTKQNLFENAEVNLKDTPYWVELQQQFSQTELTIFIHHYKEICAQFKNDITKTERMSIIDVSKLEILLSRNLIAQQQLSELVYGLENEIKQLQEDNADKETIYGLQRQLPIYLQSRQTLASEYKELFNKKESTLKILKGTRDQRFSKIEQSNATFGGLLQRLLKDPDFSEQCSLELSRMQEAIKKERERFADYHTFSDGMVDRVIISQETVTEEG